MQTRCLKVKLNDFASQSCLHAVENALLATATRLPGCQNKYESYKLTIRYHGLHLHILLTIRINKTYENSGVTCDH